MSAAPSKSNGARERGEVDLAQAMLFNGSAPPIKRTGPAKASRGERQQQQQQQIPIPIPSLGNDEADEPVLEAPRTPGRNRSRSEPVKLAQALHLSPLELLGSQPPSAHGIPRPAIPVPRQNGNGLVGHERSSKVEERGGQDEQALFPGLGLFSSSILPSDTRRRATSLALQSNRREGRFGGSDLPHLAQLSLQAISESPPPGRSHVPVPPADFGVHRQAARQRVLSQHGANDDGEGGNVASYSALGLGNPWLDSHSALSRSRASSASSMSNVSGVAPTDGEDGGIQECRNLFVNYLPQSVDDKMLHQLFSPYGDIESSKVMLDLSTRRSRCFGFVKYATLAQAKRAMQEMNGRRIEHKTLIVKFAHSDDTSSLGTPSNNVYIKGLPPAFTDQQLFDLFQRFGAIEDSRVLLDLNTRQSRGIGFVRFSSAAEAHQAILEVNNTTVEGGNKPILVKFADTDDERTQRKLRQARRRRLQHMYLQQQLQAGGIPWDEGSPYQMPISPGIASPYGFQPPPHQPLPPPMLLAQSPNIDPLAALGGMDGMGMVPVSSPPSPSPLSPPHQPLPPSRPVFANQPVHGRPQGAVPGSSPPVNSRPAELHVGSLPADVTDKALYDLFSQYGAVAYAKAICNVSGECSGFGFVQMLSSSDAALAVSHLHDSDALGAQKLQVSFRQG